MTIERSKKCEIRRHSMPIKGEPGLATVELCPAENVQAGHGSLWDITSVGCTEPNVRASLWKRSTEVAIIRYAASMAVDAVLCNLNRFFEKSSIFRLLSLFSRTSCYFNGL